MQDLNDPVAGRTKAILMIGVAGLGKSLIREHLLTEIEPLEIIEFGDIVHQLVTHEKGQISRGALRAAPSKYVSLSLLDEASSILLSEIQRARGQKNVIVIAHSAVKTDFGFYVIPEIRDFESADVDGVIVLHGNSDRISERLLKRDAGKASMAAKDLETWQQLLDAGAVCYSQRATCPMYVVDVKDDVTETIKSLMLVFDHLEMKYVMRKKGNESVHP